MYLAATTVKIARLVYDRIQWESVEVSQYFFWALLHIIQAKNISIQQLEVSKLEGNYIFVSRGSRFEI